MAQDLVFGGLTLCNVAIGGYYELVGPRDVARATTKDFSLPFTAGRGIRILGQGQDDFTAATLFFRGMTVSASQAALHVLIDSASAYERSPSLLLNTLVFAQPFHFGTPVTLTSMKMRYNPIRNTIKRIQDSGWQMEFQAMFKQY